MDARRRRATFDVTGIGPGQAVDRSEAKTVRACHSQPKEPPESRPACRAGAEGEGEINESGSNGHGHLSGAKRKTCARIELFRFGPKAEVAPFDERSVVSQNTAVAKRRLCDT